MSHIYLFTKRTRIRNYSYRLIVNISKVEKMETSWSNIAESIDTQRVKSVLDKTTLASSQETMSSGFVIW